MPLGVDAVPHLRQHGATGFVQVGAVVELAAAGVLVDVGHKVRQRCGGNVAQAKFLKAGRINQGAAPRAIQPVPGGGGGGVAARVERLRDLPVAACAWGMSRLISVLLPEPDGPSTKVALSANSWASRAVCASLGWARFSPSVR